MGTCKFCGQKAGLFSSVHKECEEKHNQGCSAVGAALQQYINSSIDASQLSGIIVTKKNINYVSKDDLIEVSQPILETYEASLRRPFSPRILKVVADLIATLHVTYDELNKNGALGRIAQKIIRSFYVDYFTNQLALPQADSRVAKVMTALPINTNELQEARFYVLNKASANFLKDGYLKVDEEQRFNDFVNHFSIDLGNLPVQYQSSDIQKVGQAGILRQIQQGIIPRTNIAAPILLSAKEHVLWAYQGVTYYLEKITKETRGRSSGYSFRVCKGVYYRTGQFRGKPVEHRSMENVGVGQLFITDIHIIFYSPTQCVKVPFKKIIGITPYSDGVEIHRDGANVKRIMFQGLDPWFLMNLLSTINI
ncbi:MAG: hypothetical protein HUK10_09030 [Bacteroides heparinolyticus]|nr:hypothetical protein [Bacteroides heparinolyticus]